MNEVANLTLCSSILATTPYYIIGLGVNVYSIDELCYCLTQNVYILDQDIMDDKLVEFLRKQLGMPELADKLDELIEKDKSVGEFVTTILNEVHYCDGDEIKKVKQILVDTASLSFTRKRKARGDSLLRAKKYSLAIDEYQYVLQKMEPDEDDELEAAIWHNIGTAYAQLFLFDKAAECYKLANGLCENRESQIQYLQAMRLSMRREQYERMILRCGYEDELIKEVDRRMELGTDVSPDSAYAQALMQIKELQEQGKMGEYYRRIDKTLNEWKQEYRKNMIVRSR